jgi:hypothetical protein
MSPRMSFWESLCDAVALEFRTSMVRSPQAPVTVWMEDLRRETLVFIRILYPYGMIMLTKILYFNDFGRKVNNSAGRTSEF